MTEKRDSAECLYKILEVHKDSSAADIKAAYRKLVKECHPDKVNKFSCCKEVRERANSRFRDVKEAYTVLSDENKRLLYDSGLYNARDDAGLQEFMGELVGVMKGACPSYEKRAGDNEFELLRKVFTDIADSKTYIRDCEQFSLSSIDSSQQQFDVEPCQPSSDLTSCISDPATSETVYLQIQDTKQCGSSTSSSCHGQFGMKQNLSPANSPPKPHPHLSLCFTSKYNAVPETGLEALDFDLEKVCKEAAEAADNFGQQFPACLPGADISLSGHGRRPICRGRGRNAKLRGRKLQEIDPKK